MAEGRKAFRCRCVEHIGKAKFNLFRRLYEVRIAVVAGYDPAVEEVHHHAEVSKAAAACNASASKLT